MISDEPADAIAGRTLKSATGRTMVGQVRSSLTGKHTGARHSLLLAPKRCTPELFDHLVGTGQQGGRNNQVQRLGARQVDHEIKLYGLLNRDLARLCST